MIYFIRAGIDGPVKIGWSTNIPARMNQLQIAQPFKMNPLRTLDAPRWVERWLHRTFEDLRLEGEWFSFSEDMLTIEPPSEAPSIPNAGLLVVRKLLSITPELAKAIADYRFQHRIATESEATRRLIEIGLEAAAKSKPPTPHGKRVPAG